MSAKLKERESDLLETYFKQIKAYPLLTFDEELALSKRVQKGDIQALHKLVNSNLRLVVKIARAYAKADAALMDLVQEGNMGLMHAAEKYSHLKNVRFCTYAAWWIRQFISRYLSGRHRMVRLPHRKEEMLRRIRHTYHTLSQTLARQPRSEDVAGKLGISARDVDFIVSMSAGHFGLETEARGGEGASALETHADYTYSPEHSLLRQSSRDGTLSFLNTLKDRERRVLTYRYQLDGCEKHTLKNISAKMGISPETVRQIELKALKKMRGSAEELRALVFQEAM